VLIELQNQKLRTLFVLHNCLDVVVSILVGIKIENSPVVQETGSVDPKDNNDCRSPESVGTHG
jgi:hypothetical protein